MPRCVDCGTETPREEMYGPPDELRCRACVQKRFPTTNATTPHRSTVFVRRPPVTLAVIIVAVVVTLLYASHVRGVEALIANPVPVWQGQLWRLLTTVFPHAQRDLLHILFNAIWIWQLGKGVEGWMGSLRYAGFFAATAVGSSATELLATGAGGIGLSGVVYALFGLLVVLRREEEFAADLMPPRTIQLFVIWFFLCIVLTYANVMRVANVAHGSGAVIGWLFGHAILSRRRLLAIAGACLVCVALALSTLYMPWDWHYDWHRADKYYAHGDYAQALEWYERAARVHPGDADVESNIKLTRDMLKREEQDKP